MKSWNRLLIVLGLFLAAIQPLSAQSGSEADPDCPVQSAVLMGRVTDKETGTPVGFVNILLEKANRSVTTDANGYFELDRMRCGQFNLRTFRIGYVNLSMPVTLVHNDTTLVNISLSQSTLMMQDVTVEATRDGSDSPLHQPPVLVSDKKLHQNLGKTIAETVDYEPGISQRSMGPAPARPVLRGLGGDRLLLLEDGATTGDLSATSADHAVVIEPMTAERIEVIRGPEALTYGSNALGGVINVVRNMVPGTHTNKMTGSLSLQNETVNNGTSGGGEASVPLGPLTGHLDGSIRQAGDIHTPAGNLLNTNIDTYNGSAGLSLVRKWGLAGVAGGYYNSRYGIPPDPNGGHPSGVDINMERYHSEAKFEYHPHRHWIQTLQLHHTWSRYYHEEIEASGELGMNFGVVTHKLTGEMDLNDHGTLRNGKIGFDAGYRNFATGGLSFTPNAQEYSGAMYYYQETYWGHFLGHATLRYDWQNVTPEENRWSRQVGQIRERSFRGISASASLHYSWNNWIIGNTITRTFRAPGVQELFSEGPHLAAYSYEVGNADLHAETGLGLEAFANYQGESGSMYLAIFQNRIDGYLIPVNTGERSWRRADLFVYRYLGENVIMRGVEWSANHPLLAGLGTSATISYVWAELIDQGTPVPRIPPLEGKLELHYRTGNLSLGTTIRAADRQDRIGEFETPTAGYATMDVQAQYTFSGGPFLHSISFSLLNAGNTEYRKHLNRVKQIMPEPGRNVRLLYKVFF